MRRRGGSQSDKQGPANSGVRAQVHPILLFARTAWPRYSKQDELTVKPQISARFSQVQESRPSWDRRLKVARKGDDFVRSEEKPTS